MTGPGGRPQAATAEILPEPSGAGTVVLDLGGDLGAAVVWAPAGLDGTEIEIRPERGEWTGRHVAVRSRPFPDRVRYAAVFSGLAAGEYRLRLRPHPPGGPVVCLTVAGAAVSEVDWPA